MPLPELSSSTLADQAHGALRTAIITGDLAWGERITERGLAARLGVSATPVREALRRLEQERLVERTGPRTLRVVSVSASVRAEAAELEATLEGLAAKFAARKISDARLDEIDRLLDAVDADRAKLVADQEAGRRLSAAVIERVFNRLRQFHALVEAAADSDQLVHMLEQARAFSRAERLRTATRQVESESPALLERYGEHRKLAAALRERDEVGAERLARSHAESAGADLADSASRDSAGAVN